MSNNSHLLPELIINLVDKFKNAGNSNEKFNIQLRLEAIRDICIDALTSKKEYGIFKNSDKKRK